MDYHVSPITTVVGFALAGGGTNWGLANALGTGRSDALQVGGYGISWFGPAYRCRRARFHQSLVHYQPLGAGRCNLTANFDRPELRRPVREAATAMRCLPSASA